MTVVVSGTEPMMPVNTMGIGMAEEELNSNSPEPSDAMNENQDNNNDASDSGKEQWYRPDSINGILSILYKCPMTI